ncbi:P-loop containing nucleoside triphosphate hydrolase protein [Ascoidea rubescens DSM 1968]|uniref:p-loop containing nucleoside triphosphate hydrolase protein n=1 Tax=Ascoidea rubescens DSM 1968 TaxID=1344418 RepID=A0A1D2VC42_9ASCO|nr:P-loop containing nucleoside triphosphate hydrolase protein [Ascoidea rubescens DSM 1968]ODV59258.1 P-loop containing nucleoside triphosphate hydrolase protein [Ascoidea rubescens DSM 1968]
MTEIINDEIDIFEIAKKNWLFDDKNKKKLYKTKRDDSIISLILNHLLKNPQNTINTDSNINYNLLTQLESLNYLESYLWVIFDEFSTNDHIISVSLLLLAKSTNTDYTASIWSSLRMNEHTNFNDDNDQYINSDKRAFISLFERVLSLLLSDSYTDRLVIQKTYLLAFINLLLNNLDYRFIKSQLSPIFNILIWSNLSANRKQVIFNNYPHIKKMYNKFEKKFNAQNDQDKTKHNKIKKSDFIFRLNWLYHFLLDYIFIISANNSNNSNDISIKNQIVIDYSLMVFQFLIDILSQLSTRAFTNSLVKDINLLAFINLYIIDKNLKNSDLLKMFDILLYYIYNPIDDFTGIITSTESVQTNYYNSLESFQKIIYKLFQNKTNKTQIIELSKASLTYLTNKSFFISTLSSLDSQDLKLILKEIDLNLNYSTSLNIQLTKELFIQFIYFNYYNPLTYLNDFYKVSLLPDQSSILENYNLYQLDHQMKNRSILCFSKPLYKLGLQYLSMNDFLFRSFFLQRDEFFYQILNDIELIIKRLNHKIYRSDINNEELKLQGFSKMALKITNKPSIVSTTFNGSIKTPYPDVVNLEVQLNLNKLSDNIINEWDELSRNDIIFLVSLTEKKNSNNFLESLGIRQITSGKITEIVDGYSTKIHSAEKNNTLSEKIPNNDLSNYKLKLRRFYIDIDAKVYHEISNFGNDKQKFDSMLSNINLIVRRKKRENNFYQILSNMKLLVNQTELNLPSLLLGNFLGFDTQIHNNNDNWILDMKNNFIDLNHLFECFPDYNLTINNKKYPKILKKRKRISNNVGEIIHETFTPPFLLEKTNQIKKTISIYLYDQKKLPNFSDNNHKPLIKFTENQMKSIISGSLPGLTIILGPPGTGKTDVATQIISNVFNNFPHQKTLVITHSNHALNHLFTKLAQLGTIDEQFLLRLGYGEQGLSISVSEDGIQNQSSFCSFGRVEHSINQIPVLLKKVDTLAESLNIVGAHGNSCETAIFFYNSYIQEIWKEFLIKIKNEEKSSKYLIRFYPFFDFFSKLDRLIDKNKLESEKYNDSFTILTRHYESIVSIFDKLESFRPFEVLTNLKAKTNYILLKHAKVVAMTSTYVSMRNDDLKEMGLSFDNVLIEEAAQLTEINTVIPLLLANSRKSDNSLKRVIFIGDHNQNRPIIQNPSLKQFSKADQSLFERFIKLGLPYFKLNYQGRARSEIVYLYNHIYSESGFSNGILNLEHIENSTEFILSNPGFNNVCQFINVSKYHNQGETEPSPNLIQNLGEAEFAVALYCYMRLLNYPNQKITILVMYSGQKYLVEEILKTRCGTNKKGSDINSKDFDFGWPIVSTVDNYQGQENDYILLSLCRTKKLGYIRDIRRVTVALSRARLGLYVLGYQLLFRNIVEPQLKKVFERLIPEKFDGKLDLVTGEMFGKINRKSSELSLNSFKMESLEHFGQYVHEMTETRMKFNIGSKE